MHNKIPEGLIRLLEVEYGLSGNLRELSAGWGGRSFLILCKPEPIFLKLYGEQITSLMLEREKRALSGLSGALQPRVPKLVPTRLGLSRVPLGEKTLSCFEQLPGETPYSLLVPPMSNSEILSAGRALGVLHRHWGSVPASRSDETGSTTQALIELFEGGELRGWQKFGRALSSGLPKHWIHGDYSPGNWMFDGGEVVSVCDFEYSSVDLRILDVAMGVASFAAGGGWQAGQQDSILNLFLRGYESGLGEECLKEERELLPELIEPVLYLNERWAAERAVKSEECAMYVKRIRGGP